MTGPGLKLRSSFGSDSRRFIKDFDVPENVVKDFRTYVESKDVKIVEKDYAKDLPYIRQALKAYIAQSLWGREVMLSVLLQTDKQFQKAMQLFPEAEKIARLD